MSWTKLDNSDQTVDISAGDGQLYQLHRDGTAWFYTGTPLTGWNRFRHAPDIVQLVFAGFYARDRAGAIWECGRSSHEVPSTEDPWVKIDDNPATVEIASVDGTLYQRHADGAVFRYDNAPFDWSLLDSGHEVLQIVPGDELYRLDHDGTISRYTGEYTKQPVWLELDANPATVQIAASAGVVYQRHKDGGVWRQSATDSTWTKIDDNPATVDIVAPPVPSSAVSLLQRHSDGTVWTHTDASTGWKLIDDDGRTVQVVTDGVRVYQRHRLGSIWVLDD